MTSTFKCGNVFPSGCVIYTGAIPTFMDSDICDVRLDAVVEAVNNQVEDILVDIDLTELVKNCYTFDKTTVKVKELFQETIDFVCDHETRIDAIETDLDDLDISLKNITIDLGCLTPAAAPCEQGTNEYTLLSILLTLKSEICAIKSYLNL